MLNSIFFYGFIFFIKKLSHFIIILYHKSRRLSTILAKNRPHIFCPHIFFGRFWRAIAKYCPQIASPLFRATRSCPLKGAGKGAGLAPNIRKRPGGEHLFGKRSCASEHMFALRSCVNISFFFIPFNYITKSVLLSSIFY